MANMSIFPPLVFAILQRVTESRTLDSRSTMVKEGMSDKRSFLERCLVMPARSSGASSSSIAFRSDCLAGRMPCAHNQYAQLSQYSQGTLLFTTPCSR